MNIFAHIKFRGLEPYDLYKLQLYQNKYVWGFVKSGDSEPKGYAIPIDRPLHEKHSHDSTFYWVDFELADLEGRILWKS